MRSEETQTVARLLRLFLPVAGNVKEDDFASIDLPDERGLRKRVLVPLGFPFFDASGLSERSFTAEAEDDRQTDDNEEGLAHGSTFPANYEKLGKQIGAGRVIQQNIR